MLHFEPIRSEFEYKVCFQGFIEKLDSDLFAAVKSGKEITIPSGWPGHAIVINLAPSQEKPDKAGAVGFDLRVFNLGIGS